MAPAPYASTALTTVGIGGHSLDAVDGSPAEAAFRLSFALENPLFRWFQWNDGVYVPFELPAVGDAVTLPAATISFERSVTRDGQPGHEAADASTEASRVSADDSQYVLPEPVVSSRHIRGKDH